MSSHEPPRPPTPPAPPTQPTQPLNPRVAQPAPVVTQPVVERYPPELPLEGPWWDNPWPAIVVGILGLIAGGLLGYALGGKGETVTEGRSGPRAAITRTVTHTTTVVHPTVVVRTNTVTARTVTQTPAPANSTREERRSEAEANLRRVERENEELKRQAEEN